MSDLQMALIALGALIIVGVVVYNWLQERKMRKNISEEFIVPQKDVLADDFYIDADAYVDKALEGVSSKGKLTEKLSEVVAEPTHAPAEMDDEQEDFDAPVLAANSELVSEAHVIVGLPRMESVAEQAEDTTKAPPNEASQAGVSAVAPKAAALEEAQKSASPLPSEIHPQIDLIAFLYSTKNMHANTLNAMAEAVASDMGVAMMVHGIDAEGRWHLLKQSAASDNFKQIACSIQLADRSGPISKHMLNKFQFAIENMGLELGAHVEWQGSGDAMQRAIELDKFCIEVDQLVSLHLVQGEAPVHGTKFRGLAEASGMRLGEDGKFYFYNSAHPETPQFTLVSSDNQPFTMESLRSNVVKGATFQVEIPKVANCDQTFNQMIQIAQKMANSLGVRMVDDNQKPLGDLQIEKIRQQLKVIHATMVARGVMPGSPSSARLFN